MKIPILVLGASNEADLEALAREKVDFVVVGKAFYEGRVPFDVFSRKWQEAIC